MCSTSHEALENRCFLRSHAYTVSKGTGSVNHLRFTACEFDIYEERVNEMCKCVWMQLYVPLHVRHIPNNKNNYF